MADTVTWALMRTLPRVFNADIGTADIPTEPGVFVWFRNGEPVQLGAATGAGGLRRTLAGPDHTEGPRTVSTAVAARMRTGLAALRSSLGNTKYQRRVDSWLADCAVAWKVCPDKVAAKSAHRDLIKDWNPLGGQPRG